EHVLELAALDAALRVLPLETNTRTGRLRRLDLGLELQLQRSAELGSRIALQMRIRQWADRRAAVEKRDVGSEATHRLAELEPDDARADDRERARDPRQLEDRVARENAVAHALEDARDDRRAARGDDDR